MKKMTEYCKNLKNINITSFDTKNVSDMSYMFNYWIKLSKINLEFFRTPSIYHETTNVIDMYSMFNRCYKLISIDVSKFDTRNLANMRWLFSNCENLTEINLNNFNQQKL